MTIQSGRGHQQDGAKTGARAGPAGAAKAQKIDEQILAVAQLKQAVEAEPPGIFVNFLKQIAPVFRVSETSNQLLKAFTSPDVKSEKLAQALKGNAYYEHNFVRIIAAMTKREQLPSVEAAVPLLGIQNSRNHILALQLLRSISGQHPEWGTDGKLKIKPADFLKYSIKTEDALAENKLGYADSAFAGGFVFDILAQLAEHRAEDKKKAAAYIDSVYTMGLKAGKIGIEMSKQVTDFGFKRFVFAACLVREIGKAIMGILDPEYIKFVEDCDKKTVGRVVRDFAEKKRFGINHYVLGAAALGEFELFRQVSRAILFQNAPALLKTENKHLFQLAAVVRLAGNMAPTIKKVERSDDPIIATWNSVEIRDLRLSNDSIVNAVGKLLQAPPPPA